MASINEGVKNEESHNITPLLGLETQKIQPLLIQLYIANQAGDIPLKLIIEIIPYVIEEEFRRNIPKLPMDPHKLCLKVLNPDNDYITKKVKEFEKYINSMTNPHAKRLIEETKVKEEIKNEVLIEGKPKEYSETSLCERAQKILAGYNSFFTTTTSIVYETVRLISLFEMKPYEKICDMGITKTTMQLAFLIQTVTERSNAIRRNSIAHGNFVNCFDEESSLNYIKKLYNDTITLEINMQKKKIDASLLNDKSLSNITKFALSKSPETAANFLKGICRGENDFKRFARSLEIKNCPCVIEKLKMLTRGNYNGIKLIMDNMKSKKELEGDFVTWKPNKHSIYRIWVLNSDVVPIETWVETLPNLKEYLEAQNNRSKGIFVPFRNPKPNVCDRRHRKIYVYS